MPLSSQPERRKQWLSALNVSRSMTPVRDVLAVDLLNTNICANAAANVTIKKSMKNASELMEPFTRCGETASWLESMVLALSNIQSCGSNNKVYVPSASTVLLTQKLCTLTIVTSPVKLEVCCASGVMWDLAPFKTAKQFFATQSTIYNNTNKASAAAKPAESPAPNLENSK